MCFAKVISEIGDCITAQPWAEAHGRDRAGVRQHPGILRQNRDDPQLGLAGIADLFNEESLLTLHELVKQKESRIQLYRARDADR